MTWQINEILLTLPQELPLQYSWQHLQYNPSYFEHEKTWLEHEKTWSLQAPLLRVWMMQVWSDDIYNSV